MLALLVLLFGGLTSQNSATPTDQKPSDAAPSKADTALGEKLLRVRRIYVESFGDDVVSKQFQAMLINSLTESKKFIITENKEKADAVLKGTGLERTSQELHAIGEGTAVGAAAAAHSGSVSGSVVNGNGSISGSSSGGAIARSMATQDSQASTETINDARLAVRLVSGDGDVIWATTKESKGAKYKGASADVADQIVKQLLRDLEKLQSQPSEKKSAN
jgi:curli biogenesis system outer membrane secretion channel CsgG